MSALLGRWGELNGTEEVQVLEKGMDFRRPEYRRECFIRFYQFHAQFAGHPGGVYYLLPYLKNHHKMTVEQSLWLAFINGCSQHPPTTYYIWTQFPDLAKVKLPELKTWFYENYAKMGWDTDRRYAKNKFIQCVECYQAQIAPFGSQAAFFEALVPHVMGTENFQLAWPAVLNHFDYFGRLSTFSYLEYLNIIGLNVKCDRLFLEDLSGSKSHRNGLCKVLGRDDLDWHHSNPAFPGHDKVCIEWLAEEGALLLRESEERSQEEKWVNAGDVGYFTLESALCAFKSFFRPNRRYPNVYQDMLHDRLLESQRRNPDFDFSLFWKAREFKLPPMLRLEAVKGDPGLSKRKQNWFRETGQLVMLDHLWPCFQHECFEASLK